MQLLYEFRNLNLMDESAPQSEIQVNNYEQNETDIETVEVLLAISEVI